MSDRASTSHFLMGIIYHMGARNAVPAADTKRHTREFGVGARHVSARR